MAFDIARVRGLFPALGDGWAYLDAPAGMQVPETVAAAVSTALRAPGSGPMGIYPTSQRASTILREAREAIADLVGAKPEGIVLGSNPAELVQRLANAAGESWVLGDEVLVSRLDDPTNIEPWRRTAQRAGAGVRWAEIDIENCELPAWQYERLISTSTKVVAVTAASPVVGTSPDIPWIAELAKRSSAMLVVDACAAAPFTPLDIGELGADVLIVSAGAWGGPPLAALAFADPGMLDRLPSAALLPDASGAARLEVGAYPYSLLAGLTASIDHLAGMDDAHRGGRRERLGATMRAVRTYHENLLATLLIELRALPGIHVIGNATDRVPVLAFTVDGMKAEDAVAHLARHGVYAFADPGTTGVFGALGVGEVGGAVRLGLAHYTSAGDVYRLVSALADLG
ncbi:cysteine desulfurase-like protein [Sciscionella marina]|uniref:cysteine desulfurase-like protein n=1 Tax=Sciscionella marina TaxID=508770 RepID=UPI0003791968|nr:cysteine desulfurase-like protein [Sciscionella marina]